MQAIAVAILLISVAVVANAESGLGACPTTIVSQSSLDAESYFGLWYIFL